MPRKRTDEEEARKVPFSPREVGRITREFYADVQRLFKQGGQYNGSKLGHQFELRYNPAKKTVWWRVCIDRRWIEDTDSDVFHALCSIGNKIDNKAFDKRLSRMLELEERGPVSEPAVMGTL